MHQHALRLCAGMGALLLLAGCSIGHRRSAELNQRFEQQLRPQLANGQVAMQPLPDGTRLVIADNALFLPGSATLTDHGRFILASTIEGLLAPQILQIDLAESAAAPAPLQQARVQAVTAFMRDFQLDPTMQAGTMPLQTVAVAAPGTTQTGLDIVVTLRPRRG